MKTSRDEQSELICAALAGDQDAYSTLHARYKQMVVKAVRSFSRDADDLEDLVQDAFLQIFAKLGSFQGDADFGTWCYRVAYNIALMRYRKPERRIQAASFSIDDKQDDGENESKWEPSGGAIEYEFAGDIDKLRKAMKELPNGYRSIIEARMEGVEYKQIAKELGLHVGTAKSQTIRATEKLRVALTKGKPMTFTTEYDTPTAQLTNTPPIALAPRLSRKCKCGCGEGIPDRGWPYKAGHTPAGVRAKKNSNLKLADLERSRVVVREVATKPAVTIPVPEKPSAAVAKLGIILAAQRGDLAEVVKLVGAL